MSATSPLKSARIELRVTPAQKESIEAAAATTGRTMTEFSSDVLVREAEAVIQRDRELRIEAARFDEFRDLLDRPAESLEGLRSLLARKSVFVD